LPQDWRGQQLQSAPSNRWKNSARWAADALPDGRTVINAAAKCFNRGGGHEAAAAAATTP